MKNSKILKPLLMKSKKNYKVIISDSAKADIKKSAKWYNSQQIGLGKRFVKSIKECVRIIQLQPESFQLRYRNNRAAIPNKFPFLIIYSTDDKDYTIRIIAVFHSSQNPDKLAKKL